MAINHDCCMDICVRAHTLSEYWWLGDSSGGKLPLRSGFPGVPDEPLQLQYAGLNGPPAELFLCSYV